MNTFEKIERESLNELLNEMNKIDLDKWELVGHPQSYVKDNYVDSGSFGGEGLRKLTPKSIFYLFVKNIENKNVY